MTERWAGRAAVAAVLLLAAALQLHRIDDTDTWWHLASGRRIHDTGSVAATDPFSYTAPGAPWVNRQWLFDLGLFGLWRLGGSGAVALGAGALYLAAFVALLARGRHALPAWAAALAVLLATLAAVERFAARPEAVSLCALALVLLLLDRRIDGLVASAIVALQVLWANCHALSVLGLIPVAAELAGAAAARWAALPSGWRSADERTPTELRWLAVALVGGVAAEAATPFGIGGALFPLRLLRVIQAGEATSFGVVEHRATTLADLSPAAAVGFIGLLALAGAALACAARRVRWSAVLCAAAFVALGFMARRNVALVGVGVLPLLADGLGPVLRRASRRPALAAAAAGAVAVVAAGLAVRVATGRFYDDARLTRAFGLGESRLLFSPGAVDFLSQAAPADRVFNDDMVGGWILWRTRPPRPVFIDGRMQVYPATLYEEYLGALSDPARFADTAARWGITAVVLHHPAPGRLELADALVRTRRWRVGWVDAGTVVLLADGRPPRPPSEAGGPVEAYGATGVAAVVDAFARRLREPHEEAIAYYQRGRALLGLYGSAGLAPARADFEAALARWPDFALARQGLATATRAQQSIGRAATVPP